MKRYFFVTGLPRSRTAWLANLLTNGDSLCFHGGLLENGGYVERLVGELKDAPFAAVGDSDASLLGAGMLEPVDAAFPEASWVLVKQHPLRSMMRHNAAFPEMTQPLEVFNFLAGRLQWAEGHLSPHRTIIIEEDELENVVTCDLIHEHCTGRPMDLARHRILAKMSVTADKAQWLKRMDVATRARVEAARAH
jgi:hypothetical protein